MRKLLLFLLFPCQLLAQPVTPVIPVIPVTPVTPVIPVTPITPTTFKSFKSYPFPSQLCAAAKGAKLAWALDEQGIRNIYVAEGPDFTPR
jgi:hypothetical protein